MIRKKGEKLANVTWEKFCQNYISQTEFYGNGTQSYIDAYNIDVVKKGAYNSARVSASKLLTKGQILDRINELLAEGGLNDQFVDKQLQLVITQNAEFSSKIRAIAEYNKLKKRTERDTSSQIVEIIVTSADSKDNDKPPF